MTDLIIKEPLASEIRALAEREQRSPEEVLADIVRQRKKSPPPEYPVYEPRPAWSLTDEDIDVPEDIVDEQEKEAYRQGIRELRPKLYEIAREYWTKVGDTEKICVDRRASRQAVLVYRS